MKLGATLLNKRTYDVCIIGGGIMGSSSAYWITKQNPNAKVLVIEKDTKYQQCSTVLAAGGIRHQFSNRENVGLSLFGSTFIRDIDQHLRPSNCDQKVDVGFTEAGYLFLAQSEEGYSTLSQNHLMQTAMGAKNVLLGPTQLKERFPWINEKDLKGGCFGEKGEGYFDPYLLLKAFQAKATDQKVTYLKGEVTGFKRGDGGRIDEIIVNGNENVIASKVVCSAGAYSGALCQQLGIPLPVKPKKRCVFVFSCKSMSSVITPLTIDPSGVYFRSETSGRFICGVSPPSNKDHDAHDDFEVDHSLWEDIWHTIANRVPAFEEIKLVSSWAGHYEYNTFDQNGIIGIDDRVPNMVIATGFSGHGLQQAPAVGLAVTQLLTNNSIQFMELTRMAPSRIWDNKPLLEQNIW